MKRRIKVLVDGKALSSGAGVGKHLYKILLNMNEEVELTVVLTGKSLYDLSALKNADIVEVRAKGLLGRIFYEQVLLPKMGLLKGCEILYSPKSFLPFWKTLKTVVTMHDEVPSEKRGGESVFVRLYWKINFSHALRNADGLIFINEEVEKNFLHNRFFLRKKKKTVIHNGWDGYERVKESKRDIILLPQTLKKRKRMGISLRLAEALSGLLGAEKVIVTGRNDMGRLPEGINAGKTEYAGYVAEEKMAEYFSRAKLIIYLSDAEGYSLPIAEALHMGADAVAARTKLNVVLYGDMPIYYNEFESADENAATIAEIIKKGRTYKDEKKERTWREAGEATAEFFGSVLS